jgi:glycosyltransferase involved in cell wall biosynthesis
MEALACGTPVLTYNTGGSSESVDETCGTVVSCDDVDAMIQEIIKICESDCFKTGSILQHSLCFNDVERYKEYIQIYENAMF